MSLPELYQKYLQSLNVQADEHGLLSFESFGVNQPLEIDGRRLAIPTDDVLRAYGKGDSIIPFHPMSESSNRGESPVLQLLKKLIRLRLSNSIITLLADLVEISANRDVHAKMSPEAHRMLSCMPNADDKTVAVVGRIIKAMGEDARRSLNIYLKRKGRLSGQEFSRVAVIKFPLYDELCNDDEPVVFGVKMRKRDFNELKSLVEYILPDLTDPEGYAVGSNHLLVPYLDSLTQCYLGLAKQINRVANIHKDHLENVDEIKIPTRWAVGGTVEWNQYRDAIPPLEDSMGVVLTRTGQPAQVEKEVPTAAAIRNQLTVRKPAQAAPAPVEDSPPWEEPSQSQQQPSPVRTVGAPAGTVAGQGPGVAQSKPSRTVDDVLNARLGVQQPNYQMPQQAMQPQMVPVMTPQGMVYLPVQPQVAMVPQMQMQPMSTRPGDYPGRVRGAAPAPMYGYQPGMGYVAMPQVPDTAMAYGGGMQQMPGYYQGTV